MSSQPKDQLSLNSNPATQMLGNSGHKTWRQGTMSLRIEVGDRMKYEFFSEELLQIRVSQVKTG
jgi:hypothetical protein